MTLDRSHPLDILYLECVPHRPTGKPNTRLGPTHQWALYLERIEFVPVVIVGEVA